MAQLEVESQLPATRPLEPRAEQHCLRLAKLAHHWQTRRRGAQGLYLSVHGSGVCKVDKCEKTEYKCVHSVTNRGGVLCWGIAVSLMILRGLIISLTNEGLRELEKDESSVDMGAMLT